MLIKLSLIMSVLCLSLGGVTPVWALTAPSAVSVATDKSVAEDGKCPFEKADAAQSLGQGPVLQKSIAMHGSPKYETGFTHFDYTNPNAPQGGTLHLGNSGSFDSLNPFIVRGTPPLGLSLGFMSLVYESLMTRGWDEPFTLYALIAESIEVPEDRSSIVFHLAPEAHWQDGKPLTAADVQFSFNKLLSQGRPNNRTYYKKVLSVELIDKQTIRFVFKPDAEGKYDREIPLILALMPVLPQHVWEGRDFNQTTLQTPIGSGPYKVTKVDVGRSITYEKDPNYWGAALPAMKGLYNFKEIRVDYYRDDAISLQAFKAGQYDLRREADPNKWLTAYEAPALAEGSLLKETFDHQRTEPFQGFVLNTRRALLQDDVLRAALIDAFDFGWINRTLFHGAYKRCQSYFPNGELAALATSVPPQGKEVELLSPFKNKLPHRFFEEAFDFPNTDGGEQGFRDQLVKAADKLKGAGYVLNKDVLYAPNGQAVTFEVMLNDPMNEKIALQWARALKQLGIIVRVRTVDGPQYQARLASFDYDVTVAKWSNSLSPGNEQMAFWGSQAASQQGSRNYAGIQNPVVDAMAAAVPNATTREGLVAATRALDRVLLAGHYVVPFYYLGADYIAYWKKVQHPDVTPLYGQVIETWWQRPQ